MGEGGEIELSVEVESQALPAGPDHGHVLPVRGLTVVRTLHLHGGVEAAAGDGDARLDHVPAAAGNALRIVPYVPVVIADRGFEDEEAFVGIRHVRLDPGSDRQRVEPVEE